VFFKKKEDWNKLEESLKELKTAISNETMKYEYQQKN